MAAAREGLGEGPAAVTVAPFHSRPRSPRGSPLTPLLRIPQAAASPPHEPLRPPKLPFPAPPSPAAPSPQPSPPQAPSQASRARSSHLPASPLSSHRRSRTLRPRLRARSLARPPALRFRPPLPASGLAVRREAPPPARRDWPLCPSGGLAGRRAVGGASGSGVAIGGKAAACGFG